MSKSKFKLVGALEGQTIVLGNNQYPFVDGVLEVSKEDADKIQNVLESCYGAKRVADESQIPADQVPQTKTEVDTAKDAEPAKAATPQPKAS